MTKKMNNVVTWGDDSGFADVAFYADRDVKQSPTLAIASLAKKMKKEGKDVVDMSVGEPDFITPNNIIDAAVKGMREGKVKYTDVSGTPELKDAILHRTKLDYGLELTRDNVLVSCGAKHSIFNVLFATLRPDDEVVIPKPYWVSYPDMVTLAGARGVFCECADDLTVDLDSLRSVITSRTKWIIINYPSNPSGVMYTEKKLRELADVLMEYPHVNIISDDVYSALVYDGKFIGLSQIEPRLLPRMVIVHAVSKTYAMTGWRIGYILGHPLLVKRINAIQSQVTSCPSSVSQAAAVEALTGDQAAVEMFVAKFKERRDKAMSILGNIKDLSLVKPRGSFYLFPSFSKIIKRLGLRDDAEFAAVLLEKHLVSTVPGTPFGMSGYIRISYALSDEDLIRGCERIVVACEA